MNDENMTVAEFVAEHGITMTAERVPENPNMAADDKWNAQASHWFCTFSSNTMKHGLKSYFSQGAAHTKPPTAEDVLDCLASDASGVENARSFDDWADEYGYDADSRKAERTYNLCCKQTDNLRTFLGKTDFDRLLWHTERL